MESFLVYLFNFYYAISELEQNKQNNTIIFFFTIYFFNKKVDLSSLRGWGVRAHPSHPPPYGPARSLSTLIRVSVSKDKLQNTEPETRITGTKVIWVQRFQLL